MAHVTLETSEACMAFGTASLAVARVAELVARSVPDGPARDLLADLEVAHHRLRDLFAEGHDTAVHGLALSILVLANRTADALEQGSHRHGD